MTEEKTLQLAGNRPSSEQLKRGLPIFLSQLMGILLLARTATTGHVPDKAGAAAGARRSDEPAMARASGQPEEVELAESAGVHGTELLRLGYTLSHVVHAYGAMCQSITELASHNQVVISAREFHDLNQCLDVAIAGAVTVYQSLRDTQVADRENEQLGFLAHELRNSLATANLSLQLIKRGTVGFGGSTGQVLDSSMKRIGDLIDRALTEVRLRVDPEIHVETGYLLQIVDQILITAEVDAKANEQTFDIHIKPELVIEADQQAFYSALSNLIQNALKFSRKGARIQVRGSLVKEEVVVEVEDECGGLLSNDGSELFEPFTQKNENRKGLGLGLTIARRAIELNHGKLEAHNRKGKGCVFTIRLPQHILSEARL